MPLRIQKVLLTYKFHQARRRLKDDYEVIATNTVFGIITERTNDALLRRIKGYTQDRPFSVIYRSIESLQKDMAVMPRYGLIKKHLTVECKSSDGKKVYCRVAHNRIQKVLCSNGPKLLTSANSQGEPSTLKTARRFQRVLELSKKNRCSNNPSPILIYNQRMVFRK